MRALFVVSAVCAVSFAVSSPARAASVDGPLRLRLDPSIVDVALTADLLSAVPSGPSMPRWPSPAVVSPSLPALDVRAASTVPSLPPHYAWVERDTRAFWYSAGAGAVTTLGAHVLVGLPALVLGSGGLVAFSAATPVATLPLALAMFGGYVAVESLLSSYIAMLVFDGMSETYESHYLTGLVAHFAGGLLSTAVTTLTFGGGALLFHGVASLSEFTGSAGLVAIQVFSILGALPAVVLAGVALVAVPALVTSWALAVAATPKQGYAIDDDWLSPTARALPPHREPTIAAVTVPIPALGGP